MYAVFEGLTVKYSIFICLLCYRDKFVQTYMYANCMEGKNVFLHTFMYNIKSDFRGARQVNERGVNTVMTGKSQKLCQKLSHEFLAHLVFYQTSLCNHDLSIVHSCQCCWH